MRVSPLLVALLAATLFGCGTREMTADIINQAVPLKETAFVTIDPAALGGLAGLLRFLLIPAAFLALWTVLQQYRHEEPWGERLASVLEWTLLLVLLGAPLVMLGGVDQIGRAIWPEGLTADWIRHDVLKWRIPGLESGGVEDWNPAATGATLATLMVVPGWHAALELLGLAALPLALIFSLFVRGLRPLAAWVAGFAIWAFFAPLWHAGLTLLAATPGNVDNHFTLFTGGLMALVPLAQMAGVVHIVTSGRPQLRLSPATRQMAMAILAERLAEGGGGGGQAAPAAAGGPGNPGNPGNPGGWPAGPYLALPPPSGGGGGGGSSSSPPSEPTAGPNSQAGSSPSNSSQGPAGKAVEAGARVAGVAAGAAAAAEGLPPPVAGLVAKATEAGVKNGLPGKAAAAFDHATQSPKAADAQGGVLPPVTGGQDRPPVEEAATAGNEGSLGRPAAANDRRYAYATDDVVANGQVICRKGQIIFPDGPAEAGGALIVDGHKITPDQYTWRG